MLTWMKQKKIILMILLVLLLVVLSVLGYGLWLYQKAEQSIQSMHEEITRTQPPKRATLPIQPEKQETYAPISILILGVDARPNDHGRSDTMIVLTLNPELHSMNMLSIQRDIRTSIIGKGIVDKINHAYAYGGSSMAVETVEHFLDIPIDYFVTVDMNVFAEIIDILGGITVNNPIRWADEGYYQKGYVYEKGWIELDTGAKALGFVRMRHLDPRGDFGRNERQRILLEAMMKKASQMSSITKVDDILERLSTHVKTNLTMNDIKRIIAHYGDTRRHIEQLEFKATGMMMNGISYQIVSDEERERISEILKRHLYLDQNHNDIAAQGELSHP